MARHHCGAENADAAKFCCGCGEKLQAAAPVSAAAAEAVACPACGADNKPGVKFCGKCGAGMAATAAARIPTAADIPEAPAASRKTGVIVLAGAVLVAVLAGAGWLVFGSGKTTDAPDVAQQAPEQDAEKSPSKAAAAGAGQEPSQAQRAAASTAPAARPAAEHTEPAAAAQAAQPSHEDKARRLREERAARRAEQEERRAAEVARREAAAREAASRNEAAARRAPQPAADNSIQQKCSTARNEFSRSLCETRECSRPDKYNTPYCVAFRKRYNQEDSQQF